MKRPERSRKSPAIATPIKRRSLVSRLRRAGARVVAWASDPQLAPVLVVGFTIAHAVLWTAILTQVKAAQDVHFDVAEAYAWGRSSCSAMASIRRCRAGLRVPGSASSR
ncbi:hypothetical protein [Tardiphaga alba]|uniref:hypothetical protein n=1 Tax=Tardiphaga alba TaxID=340268 RepID=UPI002E1C15D3